MVLADSFYRLLLYEMFINFYGHCRGFTKFSRTDYLQWKSENRIMNDGVNAKVLFFYHHKCEMINIHQS